LELLPLDPPANRRRGADVPHRARRSRALAMRAHADERTFGTTAGRIRNDRAASVQVNRALSRFERMVLVVGWSGPSTRSLSARVVSYRGRARPRLPRRPVGVGQVVPREERVGCSGPAPAPGQRVWPRTAGPRASDHRPSFRATRAALRRTRPGQQFSETVKQPSIGECDLVVPSYVFVLGCPTARRAAALR
jgi:hypothetical protein